MAVAAGARADEPIAGLRGVEPSLAPVAVARLAAIERIVEPAATGMQPAEESSAERALFFVAAGVCVVTLVAVVVTMIARAADSDDATRLGAPVIVPP